MTIATWNIERVLTLQSRFSIIQDQLKLLDADIVVLTETNSQIDLGSGYSGYHSAPLPSPAGYYHEHERRVSIYSKYPSIGRHETYRDNTAICCEFNTSVGPLAIYGTVMGVLGNRRVDFDKNLFNNEVDKQIADINKIAKSSNICVAGDFNMSFSDNYYHTKSERDKLNSCFIRSKLYNVTAAIPDNIDHIVLSKALMDGKAIKTFTWNNPIDKKLSDHKGVAVTLG